MPTPEPPPGTCEVLQPPRVQGWLTGSLLCSRAWIVVVETAWAAPLVADFGGSVRLTQDV
ncbi:hypothetical protein CK485_27460 [Streptomyces sp. ICBB 8177]|nr:hypothetical protein CK485_27460 [Streptomyces sp. ICBB 8177]